MVSRTSSFALNELIQSLHAVKGGNCDIKNLSRGCTVYFPVFVDGAMLSMGDMHMSQGDGEVSFCGAIGKCSIFLRYFSPMSPLNMML